MIKQRMSQLNWLKEMHRHINVFKCHSFFAEFSLDLLGPQALLGSRVVHSCDFPG